MTDDLNLLPVEDAVIPTRWSEQYALHSPMTLRDGEHGEIYHCSACLSNRFVFGSTPWQVFCWCCHSAMADPVHA